MPALTRVQGGAEADAEEPEADRQLLAALSASYSELERQRLAKEREGAWHTAGTWDFAATPGLGPFTEPPRAYESEPVGQVMHAELGGLLVGGWGLQIYPMSVVVGNDLRLVIDAEVVRGSEFWIFLRGVPPAPCYQFRIGSYGGRWLVIARSTGEQDLGAPELLTMRPLRRGSTTAIDMSRKVRLHRIKVVIEVVGSRLALTFDDQPQLVVQDTCPLSGPLTRQLGIGTLEAHAIVRSVTVQQRSSPLMLPAFAVANELLRQNLYPQAIDQYRTFLAEHTDSAEAIEPDLSCLEALYGAGLRSIGPVWSRPNQFGHGVPFRFPASPDTGPGLTDAGKALVRECNALGIVIDLSHLNEHGFWDVAKLSTAPLIASHSNAHVICPSSRNLTDDQIKAVGQSGGLIGLNFANGFLRPDGLWKNDTGFDILLRHLDRLMELAGADHVGLGSDFDGARIPAVIGDVAGLPNLVEALRGHGYDEATLRRLCYDNWIAVLERIWGR